MFSVPGADSGARPSFAPRFVRLTRANLPQLADGLSALCAAVEGWRPAPAYWQWRYFDNPVGGSLTVVAVDGGRVLGKFGGVLVSLMAGGRSRTACLMEGLSVLPSQRSWDLYRGLLASHAEHSLPSGVELYFGFSTRLAARGHRRLGYPALGRCPIWTGVVDARGLLRSKGLPGSSLLGAIAQPIFGVKTRTSEQAEVQVTPLEQFPGEVGGFCADPLEHGQVRFEKNAAYLDWRYVRCPGRSYRKLGAWRNGQLEGYTVFTVLGKRARGYLLELAAREDDPLVLSGLALESLRGMAAEGAVLVSASFRRGSPPSRVLRSLGFNLWGTWFWDMRTILAGAWSEAGLLHPQTRWDFTLGDWLYH